MGRVMRWKLRCLDTEVLNILFVTSLRNAELLKKQSYVMQN